MTGLLETLPDRIRFIGQWLISPLRTGAISPSSRGLAHAMAESIPDGDGPVIELGPGTGVMTSVMIERGIAPERIFAIEYNKEFADKLKVQFPDANIIQGDAYALEDTIGPLLNGQKAIAAMCSLPLFTQPVEKRISLFEQTRRLSTDTAPYILFSYAHKSPIPCPEGFSLHKSAWVKKNIPPARAWTFRPDSNS